MKNLNVVDQKVFWTIKFLKMVSSQFILGVQSSKLAESVLVFWSHIASVGHLHLSGVVICRVRWRIIVSSTYAPIIQVIFLTSGFARATISCRSNANHMASFMRTLEVSKQLVKWLLDYLQFFFLGYSHFLRSSIVNFILLNLWHKIRRLPL